MDPQQSTVLHEGDVEPGLWDDPIRGLVAFRTLICSRRTATRSMTSGVADLPTNGWLGRHRHTPAELYYVLDGTGVVVLDGVEHGVRGGSVIFIPSQVEHGLHNVGLTTLRFFYVFALDSFDDIDYRFSATS